MATLDSFNEGQQDSIDSFSVEASESRGVNKATASQKAAYTAVLSKSGKGVAETYAAVNNDLSFTGKSSEADQVMLEERDRALLQDRLALGEVLVDSNIPLEEKQAMATSFIDSVNERYTLRNVVSNNAIASDSEGENAEQEMVRVNTGAIIQSVNNAKKQRQAMLNAEVAKSNPDTTDSIVDFLELIVPFAENKGIAGSISDYRKAETTSEKAKAYASVFTLAGSAKADLIGALKKMPDEDRFAATQSLVDAINNNSSLLLPDDNDLARVDMLNTFLDDGYYTTVDEWIDNTVSVLDLVALGGVVKPFVQGMRVARNAVKTEVKATSVAQNYKDTNPAKAKALHEAALADEGEDVAQAAYGTTKQDAVANDLVAEVLEEDGSVINKVGNIGSKLDQEVTPDAKIIDAVDNVDGAIYYFRDEKVRARAKVFNDFRNPLGLTVRSEMTQVGDVEDKVSRISNIYGPMDGGFATAQEAIDSAKYNLAKYGITEDNITLMMQKGDSYVPVPDKLTALNQANGIRPQGGFLAKVDYDYTTSPLDIDKWSEANVKWNLFDRIPGPGIKGQGSFQRHMLDAHSMLHPNVTFGAAVAVDKAAGLERNLLQLSKQFSDSYKRVDKDKQFLVEDYIRKANDDGIGFNENKLIADGFDDKMVEAIKSWRSYWDTMYWLENRDLTKTLSGRGYQLFENAGNDTRLFAKPLPVQSLNGSAQVFDSGTGEIRILNKSELSELYSNGGTVARLKDPVDVDGTIAELMISPQTPDSYLRGINNSDQVLNYRKGYYQVNYTAPKFIVERVKDKSGKIRFERAVAVAGDTRDAELQGRRLATTNGKKFDNTDPQADYFVRDNVKSMRVDSDDYWTLQSMSGRTAQRIRGQRLTEAGGTNMGGDQSFQLGPVDSMIHAARNVARRVPMRDYLEATKARFLSQYADVLPVDKYGSPAFPNSRAEIGREGRKFEKEAADARTTYEYIQSLEDGYINGIDEAYKAGLKLIGNVLGKASVNTKGVSSKALSKAERVAERLSEAQGPMGFAKNVAFQTYLAAAPLRQAVVQSHQTILLTAIHPQYFLTGRATKDMLGVISAIATKKIKGDAEAFQLGSKLSGRTVEEFKDMWDAWEHSGMGSAVDKQNLIRGSLSQMAENGKYGGSQSLLAKVAKPITVPLAVSRKVGFDTGEYFNSLASFLTYYDKAKAGNKGKLTQTEVDSAAAQARNISLNMNQAGEMPYNQNTLGMFFQFMQVPHKMMTTLAFNRGLSKSDKAKVAAVNFTLFGIGGKAAYEIFEPILPDNPEVREAAAYGMEQFLVNRSLSYMTGEETRIDFSSLAPTDMYGINDFITSLWTEGSGNIIAASPAGSLFFGHSPRITTAFKRAAQYFHLMETDGDPVQLSSVFHQFASISSGYSAAYKARMALAYGQKRNAYGGLIDSNVSTAEAMAQAFGFGSMDQAQGYLTNDMLYDKSKAFDEDFKKWYKDMKERVALDGVSQEDSEYSLRIMNAGLHAFESNKPRFQQLLLQQLKYDVEIGKDASFFKSAKRAAGIMDEEELKKYLQALPWESEENKKSALDVFNFKLEEE